MLVNSLTQSDISSRATVLDIYLSQLAVKSRKRVSAVETVQEQCHCFQRGPNQDSFGGLHL